jgi:transposase InsO family protein
MPNLQLRLWPATLRFRSANTSASLPDASGSASPRGRLNFSSCNSATRATISFQLLYGLLILQHGRREILWLGATKHPSAEWISRQLTEAYGWEQGPRYLVRDRDSIYGEVFIRRLRAMGIRDRPTAPRSPWQNGYCERLIGSTTSSYLASGIFAISFEPMQTTIIKLERTSH